MKAPARERERDLQPHFFFSSSLLLLSHHQVADSQWLRNPAKVEQPQQQQAGTCHLHLHGWLEPRPRPRPPPSMIESTPRFTDGAGARL